MSSLFRQKRTISCDFSQIIIIIIIIIIKVFMK